MTEYVAPKLAVMGDVAQLTLEEGSRSDQDDP